MKIYKVECDKGCSYTMEVYDKFGTERPVMCGACGGDDIRVWVLVYDSLSLIVRDRIAKRERAACTTK